jgi:hypothetical protein
MTERTRPQFITFNSGADSDPATIHCPFCGLAPVFTDENSEGENFCPHLAFTHTGSFNHFVYFSGSFSDKTGESGNDEIGSGDLVDWLEKIGYGNEMIVMQVSHHGMACGPMFCEDSYGFEKVKGDS